MRRDVLAPVPRSEWEHLTPDELVAFACDRDRQRRTLPTPVVRDEVAIRRAIRANQKATARRRRAEQQRRRHS